MAASVNPDDNETTHEAGTVDDKPKKSPPRNTDTDRIEVTGLDPLRVAFVSTMPPDRGNLAEYGMYMSESLSKTRGIGHVDVFANKVKDAPLVEHVNERLTIHRTWTLGSVPSLAALVPKVRKAKPDIVHINAGIRTWGKGRAVSFMGASMPVLMRNAGLRVMTTVHTVGDTVRLDQMGQGIGAITRMGIKSASWMYLRSNAVTVMLESMRQALQANFGATNIVQVSHGTYGKRVPETPVVGPTVLSFGFWGAFKDADLLVSSVQALRDRGKDAKLILAGGAHPYFPEIYQQMVERYADVDYVRFTGYVPEEDLGKVFTEAAAVVLPYRTNAGASGVLNLCRSYGRPVVISQDPGLLEQLHVEGGQAMVFQTPAGLVDGLERIIDDDEVQRSMGQANLDVAGALTIDTQAVRMRELYGSLIDQDGNRLFRPPLAPLPPAGDPIQWNSPEKATFVSWPVRPPGMI